VIALGHETHEAGKMDGLSGLTFNLHDNLAMRSRLRRLLRLYWDASLIDAFYSSRAVWIYEMSNV
jgi:hypothetical protein